MIASDSGSIMRNGGRGRGGRRGRGRSTGRGRGSADARNQFDNSLSDNDISLEDQEMNEDLNPERILDGIDDADDDPEQPLEGEYTVIDIIQSENCSTYELLEGNTQVQTINKPFSSGDEPSYGSMEKYRHMSVVDVVLSLSSSFFETLRECSNQDVSANITMKDIYLYHALLVLRTLHPLDKMKSYWNESKQMIRWSNEVHPLFEKLSLRRFYHIRKYLKGYLREDDVPNNDRGWKVARAVDAVQSAFRTVLTHPGEFLSADEGMARGSSCRNPIYTSLGKAKPLEGFRFFLLVDYETKVVINFILDTKQFTAANCANRPGKFAGAVIDQLCNRAVLPGTMYKVFADNYYNTIDLADHMMRNREILVCGTMQKKHTTPLVYFGRSKRPKPSRDYPKGALKIAKRNGTDIYIYSWMDSAGVYFIDTITGPGKRDQVSRKNAIGSSISYQVPSMIALYNRYMHGVDVFDQIRKAFGCDLSHATVKYTVRVFEILFSMILAQAYNIHRYIFKSTPDLKDETEFKTEVIRGLLMHHVVTPAIPTMVFTDHQLRQFDPGTKDDGSNRRKVVSCRACANTDAAGKKNNKRRTSYYCQKCEVGFHPECFAQFHATHTAVHTPAKKLKLSPTSSNSS